MDSSIVSPAAVPMIIARMGEAANKIPAGAAPVPAAGDDAVRKGGIALDALLSLVNLAATVTGDPFFGLHLGASHTRGLHGALEMACSTSPTLGQAFERLVKNARLIHPGIELVLITEGAVARLERRLPETHSRHEGRHLQEFVMATIVQVGRTITHRPLRLESVALSRRRPPSVEQLADFFGTSEIEFESETIRLAFPAEYLGLPCVSSDPAMMSVLDRYVHALLSELPSPSGDDGLAGLRAAIRARLVEGGATVARVAARLSVSPRTLQRQLGDAGTTFQRVLDEVRGKLAGHYLDDLGLPPDDVAARLGYSETRAFLRAYKRWTGTTPSQHRRRRRVA